ncbi:MAG: DUF3445 domain-containing protein [Alphaproteobacteria bacterium]
MTIHRPFFKSARHHAMGIKALDPADWLEFGEDAAHQLAERHRLLDERPSEVIAALPGSEAAQDELAALVLDYLERHARDRYRIETDRVVEPATGFSCDRSNASVLGRLVQEDFCLLQKHEGRYVLSAAVLCFPAHWSLAEKLGRPLIEIHAPVPGFAEQLGSPVERLFDNLSTEKPVQRLNWSLVDTDELFLPPSHRTEPVRLDKEDVAERVRLRVERQTLRRLPRSGAVVFGIRTHITPLAEAIDTAEAAAALIERLHELPSPMQTYKNLVRVKPALLAFLEARSTAML